MKTWQKILTWSIVPLYVLDYLTTIYFINVKDFGIEAEGNPIIKYLWAQIGQINTFIMFLILIVIGIVFITRWWKDIGKTRKIIAMAIIILGVVFRIIAITGWLRYGL